MSRKQVKITRKLADGSVKTYVYDRKAKPRETQFGSISQLIVSYKASSEYLKLAPDTQKAYNHAFDCFPEITLKLSIIGLKRRNVMVLRDLIAKRGKMQANMALAALSVLCRHAIDLDLIEHNPCRDVKRFKQGRKQPWTEAQVKFWLENATEAMRRAVLLALATGQRRSDLVAMTWANFDGEWITLTQQKTGVELAIPLSQEMVNELNAWKREASSVTILAGTRGQPYTPQGFSACFNYERRRLGLDVCIHGCRHLAATRLAENGASAHEIAAITGHQSLANVQRYTAQADQRRRAKNAMGRVISFTDAKNVKRAK